MTPRIDRRHFLAATAAAGLGAAPLLRTSDRRPARDAKDDPYGGFRVGAQSYTFRNFNLENCLRRMKELGLRYGEFYQAHCPLTDDPKRIKAFLDLCKEYDVTPYAWGVQAFTKDHDANKRVFDFAKALGLKLLSADPSPDSFDSLDRLCESHKIAIGIHPHGPAGKGLHRWYSAEVIMKAVKDRHALIGACLDTGHLIRAAQMDKRLDPATEVRTMGARNFGMHLKDHDNKTKTDVVYGKGVLNVPQVLAALRAVKFDGLISIEYEANPANPVPDVRACLAEFRAAVAKK